MLRTAGFVPVAQELPRDSWNGCFGSEPYPVGTVDPSTAIAFG